MNGSKWQGRLKTTLLSVVVGIALVACVAGTAVRVAAPGVPTGAALEQIRSFCEWTCDSREEGCKAIAALNHFTIEVPGTLARVPKEGTPVCSPYPCEEEERTEIDSDKPNAWKQCETQAASCRKECFCRRS